MSMRDYPVDIYGLYIDIEMQKAIYRYVAVDKKGKYALDEDDKDEDASEEDALFMLMGYLQEEEAVDYLSDAVCDFEALSDKHPNNFNCSSGDDMLYFIALDIYPSLFKGEGYNDFNEIVAEMRSKTAELLPPDYPIEKNIVRIIGTEFC